MEALVIAGALGRKLLLGAFAIQKAALEGLFRIMELGAPRPPLDPTCAIRAADSSVGSAALSLSSAWVC